MLIFYSQLCVCFDCCVDFMYAGEFDVLIYSKLKVSHVPEAL